jgi:6-phosphogluconolactonase/Glucosamine-6-phosphate isomerase/deaminase
MKKRIFETSKQAANYIADTVELILAKKNDALFCFAAGHSSVAAFEEIISRKLDFSKARFVAMDDWLNIAADADGSCTNFLHINFLNKINARPEQIRCFDSLSAKPDKECQAVLAQIVDWGGMDYILLGMGMNGHLALNEPGDSLTAGARVVELADKTKEVAVKYFSADMPPITKGITLGVNDMLAARVVQLGIFGEHKVGPVQQLLSYDAPTKDFPASAVIGQTNAEIILDKAAAGE